MKVFDDYLKWFDLSNTFKVGKNKISMIFHFESKFQIILHNCSVKVSLHNENQTQKSLRLEMLKTTNKPVPFSQYQKAFSLMSCGSLD